jgi:dipeptidase
MASSNIFEIATRNNLWDPKSGTKLDFLKVYGYDIGKEGFMVTRRTWRVFTLAAPSIQLNPLTDAMGSFGYGPDGSQPYPFSVKPDNKLTLVDIMKMTRDTYEGTPFDLGKGLAAGPFGDVMRYEAAPITLDPIDGILYPNESNIALRPERAISLYRTVYASIAQARQGLPDSVGAVVWISPYAPHHSSYVPIYTSAEQTPSSLSTGTQYKLSKTSNYWVHSVVGNYLSRCVLTFTLVSCSWSPYLLPPPLLSLLSPALQMVQVYD